MKIRNKSLKYITMLEKTGSICKCYINTCRIAIIFVSCWFFNQTFKIVQRMKIFHNVITHCNIEITHKYKVIINFAIVITDKIQLV